MSGSRLPAGGIEEVAQLGYEDAVQRLYGPVITQAIEELGAAWPELRATLDLGDAPVALVGGSVGAAVAASVLVESDLSVSAAVLVSPLLQLCAAVDSMAAQFGFSYPWSDGSEAIARRFDFVARRLRSSRTANRRCFSSSAKTTTSTASVGPQKSCTAGCKRRTPTALVPSS